MSDVVLREVAGVIGKAIAAAIPTLAAVVAKHPMFAPSVIAVGVVWSVVAIYRWEYSES